VQQKLFVNFKHSFVVWRWHGGGVVLDGKRLIERANSEFSLFSAGNIWYVKSAGESTPILRQGIHADSALIPTTFIQSPLNAAAVYPIAEGVLF
jgi:hypothetical protein